MFVGVFVYMFVVVYMFVGVWYKCLLLTGLFFTHNASHANRAMTTHEHITGCCG